MKKLAEFYRPLMWMILVGIICKAVGSFADLALPYLLSVIIDDGIAARNVPLIIWMCLAMLLVSAVSLAANLTSHFHAARASQRLGKTIRSRIYRHLQFVPINQLDRYANSSLITRATSDVEIVQRFTSMTMRMMVRAPMLAIGGTIMSLLVDPVLTCVIFGAMILIFIASTLVYRYTGPIYRRVQAGIDRMTAVVRENLFGIRVVKSFDKCGQEGARFMKESQSVRESEIRAGRINVMLQPTIAVISNLTIVALLFLGGMRVNNGLLEIGKVVSIISYINMILNGMNSIPRIFIIFSRASASAGRIEELLRLDNEEQTLPAPPPPETDTAFSFDRVRFRYANAAQDTLTDITFSVKKGQTVGVIGPTGCGKTTLLHLLTRVYRPQSGQIIVDGLPLDRYSDEQLRNKVSIAMQQYHIFSMNIAENIMLGNEQLPEKLDRVVDIAQVSAILDARESGMDAVISQYGTNLSGGQKQRINIARALYQDADILLLDDVSSALDYKTDLNLRRKLREVQRDDPNKTVLIVATRISAIRDADMILVMDHGRVAAQGRHEELLDRCPLYRDINLSQTEAAS